jgi:hypothetical protein
VKPAIKQIRIGMLLLRVVKNAITPNPFGMKPLRHASRVQLHFLSGTRQRKYAKCALLQLRCGTTKQKNVSHALKASPYGTAL